MTAMDNTLEAKNFVESVVITKDKMKGCHTMYCIV